MHTLQNYKSMYGSDTYKCMTVVTSGEEIRVGDVEDIVSKIFYFFLKSQKIV